MGIVLWQVINPSGRNVQDWFNQHIILEIFIIINDFTSEYVVMCVYQQADIYESLHCRVSVRLSAPWHLPMMACLGRRHMSSCFFTLQQYQMQMKSQVLQQAVQRMHRFTKVETRLYYKKNIVENVGFYSWHCLVRWFMVTSEDKWIFLPNIPFFSTVRWQKCLIPCHQRRSWIGFYTDTVFQSFLHGSLNLFFNQTYYQLLSLFFTFHWALCMKC